APLEVVVWRDGRGDDGGVDVEVEMVLMMSSVGSDDDVRRLWRGGSHGGDVVTAG
ncbi:hypothetical protein Tco_0059632, partial [Tanacetum coccineum]